MEGLIPFIYRAIKDRRTRSYSRCSSTGSAHGRFRVRVEDSSWDGNNQWEAAVRGGVGGGKVVSAESEMAHRRHLSLEELAGEVGASPVWRQPGAMPRGRSARFFSCIGGM